MDIIGQQWNWSGNMGNLDKLAGEFKKRDNVKRIGAVIGEVVQASPLIISVAGFLFSNENGNLRVSRALENSRKGSVELEKVGEFGKIKTDCIWNKKDTLKKGDEVICIMSEDNQILYAIDKVM